MPWLGKEAIPEQQVESVPSRMSKSHKNSQNDKRCCQSTYPPTNQPTTDDWSALYLAQAEKACCNLLNQIKSNQIKS
eukprot:CAMPEP_0172398920 /NCGR_PEP_ID=MMETSP1061-20121228/38373_1 /TAXON_ID=37318 /ORGANISM="Pseudo-nitzschia pungens, Strain cf. pungens" /LENGTH=76 /DNA_ID=CAMNT_0013131607 /DNA_START=121 /DNA_END=347 /DNA_ORIENTATION=+